MPSEQNTRLILPREIDIDLLRYQSPTFPFGKGNLHISLATAELIILVSRTESHCPDGEINSFMLMSASTVF